MGKLKPLVPEFFRNQTPNKRHCYIGPRSPPTASSIRSALEFGFGFGFGFYGRVGSTCSKMNIPWTIRYEFQYVL